MTATKVIKVAVLVWENVWPKELSDVLDLAFADRDEVLEFKVEGYGWDGQEGDAQ
jgi:hypothetical protein